MTKILDNVTLVTETIEDLTLQEEEALDSLEVACDIQVKIANTQDEVSSELRNPNPEQYGIVAKLTNEALIEISNKLGLPDYYYACSTESIIDPLDTLKVTHEALGELATKVWDRIKEIWVKLVNFMKKMWRKFIGLIDNKLGKLEKAIANLPTGDDKEYSLSEDDNSTFKKVMDAVTKCPPRNDNKSILTGNSTLPQKTFALIPDMNDMVQHVNKIASGTGDMVSARLARAKELEAGKLPTNNATSKAGGLVDALAKAANLDIEYFNTSAMAPEEKGENKLVMISTTTVVTDDFRITKKVEPREDKMKAYESALKSAKGKIADFKSLSGEKIPKLTEGHKVLTKALDDAITKVDINAMKLIDNLKRSKGAASTAKAPEGGASTNANNNNNSGSTQPKASKDENVDHVRTFLLATSDALQDVYKRIGNSIDVAIAIAKNIQSQTGKSKPTTESLAADEFMLSMEELDLSTEGIGDILAKMWEAVKKFFQKVFGFLVGKPAEKADEAVKKAKSTMEELKASPTQPVKAKCKWDDAYKVLMYIENKNDPKAGLDLVAVSNKYESIIKPFSDRIDKLCQLENDLIDRKDIKSRLKAIEGQDEFVKKWQDFKEKHKDLNINKEDQVELNVSYKSLEALREVQNKILKEFSNNVQSGPSSIVSKWDAADIGSPGHVDKFRQYLSQKGDVGLNREQVDDFKLIGKMIADTTNAFKDIVECIFRTLTGGSEFYIDSVNIYFRERTSKHSGVVAVGDKVEYAPDII